MAETVRSVNVYMVAYLMIFAISLVLISFDNHDLITSFTAVTATINNIGPGLDLVGPTSNFGIFTMQSKIVLIFDMLAGRLELFPNAAFIHPGNLEKVTNKYETAERRFSGLFYALKRKCPLLARGHKITSYAS